MKRILCLLFVAVLVLTGFVACQKSSGTSASTTQQAKIALTMWDWYEGEDVLLNDAIADYIKINPNITIERSVITRNDFDAKCVRAAAANQLPDIFVNSISRFQAWADSKIAADITDLAKKHDILKKF